MRSCNVFISSHPEMISNARMQLFQPYVPHSVTSYASHCVVQYKYKTDCKPAVLKSQAIFFIVAWA